jgi:replicative DNA helicase
MKKFDKKTGRVNVEKYLPHNFLAEKLVLCCLFFNSEAIEIAVQNLTVETFYFRNHQKIYQSILLLYEKKMVIDLVTVTTFLRDQGLLSQIGGIKILTDILNQIPNLAYLNDYITLLKDKYNRRKLIRLGYQMINSSYITNVPLENILSELENEITSLTSGIRNYESLNTAELLSDIFWDLKQSSLKPNISGLSSGFYHLDSLTQGFQKSDLIIIAGRPGMGKTALCLNIALHIVEEYHAPIIFFSLEMSKEQLMYRLLTNDTHINSLKLKTGNLKKSDWLKLTLSIKKLSQLPFLIDDTPNLTIQDIRRKIKKIVLEQTQISLVVVDYLQLMENLNVKRQNRVQEVSEITRSLKSIAREFKVPVIALSQLNRTVETRPNKRPLLSDLRESGSIEQDADLVIMLYSDNYYNNYESNTSDVEVILSKHRNGPTGTVKLKFDSNYAQFSNF